MGTSAQPAEPDAKRRVELERLAEEQAALRRVATLVAGGASPDEVFAAVGDEVARTLGFPTAGMLRYEADQSVTMLATAGPEVLPMRTRLPPDAQVLSTAVLDAGGPARVDYTQASGRTAESVRAQGVHWGVGAPIIVERALWGVMCVGSTEPDPPPSETEARLVKFTELLATAIANAESREALAQLAEEQAALRRVATLVAAGAPPQEVFEAVSVEVAALIPAEGSALTRYEADGTVTALSGWSTEGGYSYVGERYELEGTVSGLIFQTGRPGRVENYAEASGVAPEAARAMGWHSSVGAPVTVEGRLWGVLAVVSKNESPLPPDTEQRLAAFTELVATAIANTESRAELEASRARIVATADATRRQIERDLHDGAQQRLVSLALQLRAAQSAVPRGAGELVRQLDGVATGLAEAIEELGEIARGLHPAILAESGLRPALKALARRSAVPVELDVRVEGRLPQPVEIAAYYAVAEALTNVAKHARASAAEVQVEIGQGVLHVRVRDDGCGGAGFGRGSGLVGLKDRVEALGGRIRLDNPPGTGTALDIVLPLGDPSGPRRQPGTADPAREG
jgi:signal transduction histidine kinase